MRWRFTAHDGKSFHGEIWVAERRYDSDEPWAGKIAGLSGELNISVPVHTDLPWHRKPFQAFRVEKRVPYKNGLINGSVIRFDEDGHETSVQQYREGKEHGIECFFRSDGSFSHLNSYKNGVMDGPRISCWTNGLLSATDIYSRGELNGLSREWWPSGDLREQGEFANYKRIGKHTFWLHHNGAKSHEIQHSSKGVPLETTVWAADGTCIGIGAYKEGREWEGYFAQTGKGTTWLGYFSGGQCLKSDGDWLEQHSRK